MKLLNSFLYFLFCFLQLETPTLSNNAVSTAIGGKRTLKSIKLRTMEGRRLDDWQEPLSFISKSSSQSLAANRRVKSIFPILSFPSFGVSPAAASTSESIQPVNNFNEDTITALRESDADLLRQLREVTRQRMSFAKQEIRETKAKPPKEKEAKETKEEGVGDDTTTTEDEEDEVPEGESESQYRVVLPDLVQTDLTDKLSKKWDVDKIFGLDKDFDSVVFYDKLYALEADYENFKRKYLRNDPKILVANFSEAIEEFDKLHEPIKTLAAFHHADVHLFNSDGIVVSAEAGEMFHKFKALYQERFPTILNDFKQLVRAMSQSEFRAICELPIAVKYLPYLRSLKADFSVKIKQQYTAMSFMFSAAESPVEIGGSNLTVTQIEENIRNSVLEGAEVLNRAFVSKIQASKNKEKLLQNYIQKLRWEAFVYSFNPGSRASSHDRYAYINMKQGITARTSAAMLEGFERASKDLWKRFINLNKKIYDSIFLKHLSLEKKLPFDVLLNAPNFSPPPASLKNMTWQEQDQFLLDLVSEFSPTFGRNMKELHENGRVLWERVKDEKANEVSHPPQIEKGSFAVKPIIHMTYQPQYPDLLRHAAVLYAKAGAFVEETPSNLMPESRKHFLLAIDKIIFDYFNKKLFLNATNPSAKFWASSTFLAQNWKPMQLNFVFDHFESGFHKLCDSLGLPEQTKVVEDAPMPKIADVQALWEECLNIYIPEDFRDNATSPVESRPLLTSLRNPSSHFTMNRNNYLALVAEYSYLAVDTAVRNEDGSFKSAEDRDEVFKLILKGSTTMFFDDYINMLGGNSTDHTYWENLLNGSIGKRIEACEKDVNDKNFSLL